jgi:hypothetical protein
MPSGALTPQIEQVLLGSGLAQALEEINPAEVFDKQSRITRLGEGGIPSLDAIPDEARSVQPSTWGSWTRSAPRSRSGPASTCTWPGPARKGRTAASTRSCGTPRAAWSGSRRRTWPTRPSPPGRPGWPTKRVPVMKGGKLDYVPRRDRLRPARLRGRVQPAGQPGPVQEHGQGAAGGDGRPHADPGPAADERRGPAGPGRACPARGPRSFEEEYGKHMGAVRADQGGRVDGVKDGVIQVRYDDGTRARSSCTRTTRSTARRTSTRRRRSSPARRSAGRAAGPVELHRRQGGDGPGAQPAGGVLPVQGVQLRGRQVISESRRQAADLRAHVPARPGGHRQAQDRARRRSSPCSRASTTARRWTAGRQGGHPGRRAGRVRAAARPGREGAGPGPEQDPQEAQAGVRR